MIEADKLDPGVVASPDGDATEEKAAAIAIMFSLLPKHVQDPLYDHIKNLALEHLGFVIGTATEQGINPGK